MMYQKICFALLLTVSLWMLAFQAIAVERKGNGAQRNHAVPIEGRGGVINRVDIENNVLVINDQKFAFLPHQLVVRKNGQISSLKALRSNQNVHFVSRMHRMVNEIWID